MTENSDQLRPETLRVAMVTPYEVDSARGNSITVARLQRGLAAQGVEVGIWQADRQSEVAETAASILAFKPSVVHGLHACRFGRLAHKIKQISDTPVVVTTTGTDVNVDLYNDRDRRVTARCLRLASAVVVFSRATAERLSFEVQLSPDRIHVIPQAVSVFDDVARGRAPMERSADGFVFCMPAGIRKVKNVLFPVPPLHSLRTAHASVKLVYAGPVIDQAVLDDLKREMTIRPWMSYLGEIPHEQMGDLLGACDVVVNSSLSEGMSSSILEAMAAGVPVLASNVEGNRSIIEDGVDGLLFDSEAEFLQQAARLMEDAELRESLVQNARERIARDHSPEAEIEAYLKVYKSVVPGHG